MAVVRVLHHVPVFFIVLFQIWSVFFDEVFQWDISARRRQFRIARHDIRVIGACDHNAELLVDVPGEEFEFERCAKLIFDLLVDLVVGRRLLTGFPDECGNFKRFNLIPGVVSGCCCLIAGVVVGFGSVVFAPAASRKDDAER
ncbi:hypothetical protein D3C74_295120 [compost metagenome]